MKTHHIPCAAIATLFVTLSLNPAVAQVAPSGTAEARKAAALEEEEITRLSPFVVSTEKDTGYIAADTLNAGRLSTNLLMTPGNIDVFTRDFINDLAVFNIDEASAWLTSARPLELGATEGNSMNPNSLAQSDAAVNVSLRGLGANPSTRNYFTSATTPKEYNVERVESSRGPNAILYGEGGPGGSVNYITKRAQNRNFATLRLRADANSSLGAALDINRKLTDKLDMRYNVNVLENQYYIDRTEFSEFSNALNLIYHPFKGTRVTADVDITRYTRPGLIMTYADQYAKWNHVPVTGKLTSSQATAAGLVNWTGAKLQVWFDGIGLMDMTGYARTAGYGLPIPTEAQYGDALFPSMLASAPGISAMAPLDREFNANPEETEVTDRAKDFQLSVDHTFGNKLSLQLAGQYSKYTADGGNYTFTTICLDPLAVLPNGQSNPNFGKPFSWSYVGRNVDYERESKSARLVAAYPLEIMGSTTTISAFLLHQNLDTINIYSDLHTRDPNSTLPITNNASLIYVYRYLDNLSPNLPDFRSMYDTTQVPTVDGRTEQETQAFELAASGSYLHDTLSIIVGFRRDSSELTSNNGVSATRDAYSGAFTQYTTENRKAYNNTTTFGLVYFPFKHVGVYANHGEGFTIQTIANKRLDGSFANANIVPAEEKAAGLRFQFGQGTDVRIIGSVGYYEAEQTNSAFAVGVGGINMLWRDLGLFDGKDYSANYIETFHGDPFGTSGANSITSSRSTVGTGWEAALTANVGNSFRLTVNGALPKTKQSEVGADYLDYVNQHFATWQALASNPANPASANDVFLVNQISQVISNFQEGRAQNLTYKYRYNIYGVYTFRDTALKGMRLGGGAQFFGPSIIGNEIGRPYDYIYAESYHLVSIQAGYPFKIRGQKVDVQLNVDNLLDYDEPRYNGVATHTLKGNSVVVPYGFKNIWPRTIRLTVTVPF